MSSKSSIKRKAPSVGSIFYMPSPTEDLSLTAATDAMNNNNMLEEDGTACATNSTSNVRKEELSSRGRSRYYIGSVLYDVADAVPTDIPESSGRDSPVTSGQQTGETPSHQTVISELTQRLATSATCPNSLRADRVYDVPAKNHGDTLPADQGSGQVYYDVPANSHGDTLPADQGSGQVYDDVPEEAGHHGLSLRQQAVNLSYEDVPPVPMVINDMYHTLENATGPVAPLTRSNTVTSEDTIYELVDYSDGVDGSFKEFQPSGLLQKLTESLRVKKPKDRQVRGKSFQLDLQKHPSPQLPPCPEGLTEKQVKRRLIVHSIVEIENSYLEALISLLENYKHPLLKNGIIPSDRVEAIFYKLDDILDCHLMFRVGLHERIKNWDEHEQLGDDFTGIAKELVLESYSEFINNYMKSNKLIKESLKERNGLEGFIRQQMKKSKELIGPKDQMIKVVQRFPQYILQIKDLIKHTPPDHDDYMKLNIALSKLENVAYQLNEKKRASEEKLAAEVILTKLWGSKHVTESVLLRQDDVVEMVYNSNGKLVYQKGRRLLLFNDMVCLIKIENSGADEKITSKWKCPMKHVEYKENAADSMLRSRVTGNTGTLLIQSGSTQRLGSEIEAVNETAAIVHKELEDLTHDQLLLTKIMSLTSSLTQEYEGLNSDVLAKHLKNVQTSIRLADEQLQMLDSCLISLSYLKNNQRVQTLFHMASPAIKQDWVMDFRAVKLAQNVINHHCWITEEPKRHYPLVVRNVDMNVTSQHTQVTCATPIFLTHSSGGIGLQYLWVCSNNDEHGQVTLLSIHANQPHIIESFEACEGVIDSCLLVPSHIHSALDQLWMSDCKNSVYVHGLRDTEWRSYSRKFSVPARVKVMCCHGEFVYLGLFNGSVLKYSKKKCSSLFMEPQSQQLVEHDEPVSCLLLLEQNKILAACGSTLFILSAIQELKILERHEISGLTSSINKMVQLGYGIWYSCVGDPSLRLMHHEMYNNISEVHIGNALARLLPNGEIEGTDVSITALTTSQGLVWVGTNTGHILTIPVPILEGIPQQSGRVNLSSVCHTSPVRFICTVQCSITFAPHTINEEDVNLIDTTEQGSMGTGPNSDDDEYVDFEAKAQPSPPSGPSSAVQMKQKLAARATGAKLGQSKVPALSTPNLAFNRASNLQGLQRNSHSGMYGSLMKLNDLDPMLSTADLISNLVPTNQLPGERLCTKISTQTGSTKLRVTKSSSISNVTTRAQPLSKSRKGVQSMWSLSTTSTHSMHSEPRNLDDAAIDTGFTNLNVELRAKFNTRKCRSIRDSRALSVNSLLSRVAEDDEYIFDEDLSPLEEAEDFDYSSFGDDRISTISEGEEDSASSVSEDSVEKKEALVFTNFLKASLIVSGGEGLIHMHNEIEASDESTLIMWQQNQMWT